MLSRAIYDLYYLKRIHSVLPDQKLGHALRGKLSALDLRAGPSPGAAALRRLLECLVHFQLGNSPVTANAIALVREELPRMTGVQLSRTIAACCTLSQHDVSISAVPLLAEALPSMESGATVQLVESLAAAGVRHEDTWALLAEHCIRRIDSFTGRQLYRVIECFYERRVHYPDFYIVAERYICAQPSSYITTGDLCGVVECYRGLGMPVVSLLAAISARSAEGFDSGLAAVAPARARRSSGIGIGREAPSSGSGGGGLSRNAVVATFVQSTLKALRGADEAQLVDILQKCEAKQVMHAEIMEAAAQRLLELHCAAGPAANIPRATAIARAMMRFDRREWFVRAAVPLSQLLDRCACALPAALDHRLLAIADGALRLFPAEAQPSRFFAAVVRDVRLGDVAASSDARRLPLLVGVMMALRPHGGPARLEQHMPMVAQAAANAPLRVQAEIAAALAPLPAARRGLLPGLFAALAAQRSWVRALTPRDALLLLEAMARSRQPCGDVMLAVVDYTRNNRGRFDAKELVNIVTQLATLGFNDIEYYTSTTTYVLDRAPHSTVEDLCKLLYAFTFIIKGVIRVVQLMLPRLRVSASHASPRDITLLLYSTVKLGIDRHAEVTAPFCDRAVHTLQNFRGEELTSCMSSLRALRCAHDDLLAAAARTVCAELARRQSPQTVKGDISNVSSPEAKGTATGPVLTDSQLITVSCAIVQLRPLLIGAEWQPALCDVAFATLATAGAGQTHSIVLTIAALEAAPCGLAEARQLLDRANAICQQLPSGAAAAEVLVALHDICIRTTTITSTTNSNTNKKDSGMSKSVAPSKNKEEKAVMGLWNTDDRETFAAELLASPLAAHTKANLASVMASAEVRDRLRGKGLLGVLSGVSASFAAPVAEADCVSPRDIPLRDALLWHHKATRQSAAPAAPRRKSPALKPTGTPTTNREREHTRKTPKAPPAQRKSVVAEKAAPAQRKKKASAPKAGSTHHINFGVETQTGEIDEFRL